jgi:hypothetical protein
MSPKKPKSPRCDGCNKRIRANAHELHLIDALTGQQIGCYHGRPSCWEGLSRYFQAGRVLQMLVVHPDSCGPDQSDCDAGAPGWAA